MKRESSRRYYEKHKDEINANRRDYAREYYAAHREQSQEYQRKYYQEHREQLLQKSSQKYAEQRSQRDATAAKQQDQPIQTVNFYPGCQWHDETEITVFSQED